MRKLVTKRVIDKITPIENADRIETAHLGGWTVVVGKGEFKEGEEVLYFEIDSLLPIDRPEFKHLEERGTTLYEGKVYHKLKTAKLRGQISQGLVMKITQDLPEMEDYASYFDVIKYDPQDKTKGEPLPLFILKTDEERIQNLDTQVVKEILAHKEEWIATEKIDGSSCTVFLLSADTQDSMGYPAMGICSRNQLLSDDKNVYGRAVNSTTVADMPLVDYLKSLLTNHKIIIAQGEVYGEKIQGNPLKVEGVHFKLFNLIIDQEYLTYNEVAENYPDLMEVWVKVHPVKLPNTVEDMLTQVDGVESMVGAGQIEGFVWRNAYDMNLLGNRASFKVISNKYLLKH